MDRARTGRFRSVRSLVGFAQHDGRWQIRQLGRRWVLLGALGPALVLGSTPPLRAQEEGPLARAATPDSPVSLETFPLEPAPRSARLDGTVQPTGADAKPRITPSRVASPAPSEAPAPVTAGGVKREQVEQDHDLPDRSIDVKTLRAETAERLKRFGSSSEAAGGSGDPEGVAVENRSSASVGAPVGKAARSSKGGASAAEGRPDSTTKGSSVEVGTRAGNQAFREILVERQLRLDEHDHAVKELQELTHPKVTPERQAAAAHAELERLQTHLAQPAQNLLAPIFRGSITELKDAARAEMKDAIEATKNEIKDWQGRLETARAELVKADSTQNALRAERDKLFQQVAAPKARSQERESAANGPRAAEARRLARERLINAELEATIAVRPAQDCRGEAGPGGKPRRCPRAQPADRRCPSSGLPEDARPDAAPLS